MSSQPRRPLLIRVATLALACSVLTALVVYASASSGCVRQDPVQQEAEVPENQPAEEPVEEGYMGTPKSATIRVRPRYQQQQQQQQQPQPQPQQPPSQVP